MNLSLPELNEARELICRMRALCRQDTINVDWNRREVERRLQGYIDTGTTIVEIRAAERSVYEEWFARNPNHPRRVA